MLLMKKRFFEAIRSGEKTTTLRYWRRCMVRPGTLSTVPGLGKVLIEAAEAVDPDQLTDADARSDGFADLAELRSALHELYPAEQREGRKLYLVRFRLANGGR